MNILTTAESPQILSTPRASAASVVLAGVIIVALGAVAYGLHESGDGKRSLSVLFGAAFGIVLQRSRFCFLCNYRDWYDTGDARGLLGIIVALATGMIGTTLVFGAWLPDASSGRLPPDAFIGPVSFALVLGGLAFGVGMAISGSCISAHLYRLGEGSPTAPFALIGSVAGFMLGYLTWNPIYFALVADAPVIWLPRWLGYAGALLVGLIGLALLAWVLTRKQPAGRVQHSASFWTALLVTRWPAWIGGAIVGVLATVAYLRVAPLGVTAELASRARQAADALGVLPQRLEGLDTFRGCVGLVRDAALSPNGAFVIALVVASFAAALVAGQFKPVRPTGMQVVKGLGGGLLLGWGAMIALGCTIGTLLSGIMAGALSGWVFGAAVFGGIAATFAISRRIA